MRISTLLFLIIVLSISCKQNKTAHSDNIHAETADTNSAQESDKSEIMPTAAQFKDIKQSPNENVGLGVKPIPGAQLMFDGSKEMLDNNWTYWESPRLKASLPIKWKIQDDPVDEGTAMNTNDPSAAGGMYGQADIVTKEKYKDFRLHIEFLIEKEGGNSGVYLQNRYEIQVLDGDSTIHGLATVINESASPYFAYNGLGKWNSYDINFRAARFVDDKLTEQPITTVYFNGIKVHVNFPISQVWGGPNSGLDGGNDEGKGITDRPGGIKLQAEGHDVLYRNIWVKPMDFKDANTDF